MTFSHFAYNLIGSAAALVLGPAVWGYQRLRGDNPDMFRQRFGIYPPAMRGNFHGRPRIWLHAVSVGEVGVAAAIVRSLRQRIPHCQIALSTTTRPGLAQAHSLFGRQATCFFAPLDLWWPTRHALRMVQPDVLAIVETEIWPNLIITARRMGIRTAVINGRISVRTVRGYGRIRSLIRHTLSHVDVFSMISAADARRIQSLGAPMDRIAIHGNAKFDIVDPDARSEDRQWAQALFGLEEGIPVVVAGSTRDPEELAILDAFMHIREVDPRTILIIAPRHIERCGQIEAWVKTKNLACHRRTDLEGFAQRRTAPVILLDTIGELASTYSVASVVFCGGSLVAKGGQNLMEPALWGKPVIYGPSMEDFAEARLLIEKAGGGITVRNADQLAQAVIHWLRHPEQALSAGQSARQAILSHRGTAHKHADVIVQLLRKPSSPSCWCQ